MNYLLKTGLMSNKCAMSEGIFMALSEYDDLGFDTIPLWPGRKNPYRTAWQSRQPYELWRSAPHNANIGIRAGGDLGLCILDCDEKNRQGTYDNAVDLLTGLGYLPNDYPVIKTASGIGRHIYLVLTGNIPGDLSKLSPNFGAGELRYGSGAYVVAPPSVIGDSVYSLIKGDFRQLPRVTVTDVIPILANQSPSSKPERVEISIPRRAKGLLCGKGLAKYSTRSEAEQALITSLINAGHDFQSVLSLFLSHPCAGKFAELHAKSERNAIRWLKRSYDNAVNWSQTHQSIDRDKAQAAIIWATSNPWPGRTGINDRTVFIAHCHIAHQVGCLTYHASSRRLAELAGISHRAAIKATHRLRVAGLVVLDTPHTVDSANIYRLSAKVLHSLPQNCEEVEHFDTLESEST